MRKTKEDATPKTNFNPARMTIDCCGIITQAEGGRLGTYDFNPGLLLATFYQLYLQRVHNEKSLKRLGQIVLEDRKEVIAVYLRNHGLGPLLIDKISYHKSDIIYASLADCLELEPKSYMSTSKHDLVTRIVLPNSSLPIFEDHLNGNENKDELNHVRHQLSPITLRVEYRDIYENKMILERDFQ